MRPSWNEYFMLIAKLVSTRSTCNSRPVGAVLVKDRQILATGYNGSMPGAFHCIDQVTFDHNPYCHRRVLQITDTDKHNFCRASHAEANAIALAARHGVAIKGASLYVTLEPCYTCIKLLATAQIERVFFELPYEPAANLKDLCWKEDIATAGFKKYQQLIITSETLTYIMSNLTELTSIRCLPATEDEQKYDHEGELNWITLGK